MFDERFAHYLSYGATDQATARDLAGAYNGLVVPGTVAAFQREGTGGFILTLSATGAAPRYVIDSRFPLFQQPLPRPKRSHEALAEVVGVPALITDVQPEPGDFDDERIETIARNWTAFNGGYRTSAAGKFSKYAARLEEDVKPTSAQEPETVLPPYFISRGRDHWWELSRRLFDASGEHARPGQCTRVVAADDVHYLDDLLVDVEEERLVVWVSGLEELGSSSRKLALYLAALQQGTERGQKMFALYGGFFSVLASSVGLLGASHGIGFGEHRHWIELPQSGPPPARYYLPQLHRYVQQDLAYQLWLGDRRLAECPCAECDGQPPIALEYHSLMKHSVLCRQAEIAEWAGLSAGEMLRRLGEERSSFRLALHRARLPSIVVTNAERSSQHLAEWVDALREFREL